MWVAFTFAYSVRDTLDSGKHAWMIFVETLFLLHAMDNLLALIYLMNRPSGVGLWDSAAAEFLSSL